MRIVIITEHPTPGVSTEWDRLEWDDKTIMTNPDARGLFTKMVGQSIQEWAERAQMEDRHTRSRESRPVAKAEVEGEAEANAEAKAIKEAHRGSPF